MNAPIVRVYAFLLLLLALLVWKTSQWAVFDAQSLKDNSANRRPLIEAQTIHRGEIKTADGTVVAESSPVGGGSHPVYVRHYPTGSLFGNPVGYSFIQAGQTGLEQSENDPLVGNKNEFSTILDQLRGTQPAGANVTLTIDGNAQKVATDALTSAIASTPGASGYGGAVVALDPATGAIKAMASVPGFDPNLARTATGLHELNKPRQPSIITNRATQSGYPPGSTMKVVTATAALDSGQFTPSSVLSGRSPQTIGGVPLSNAGGEQFGDIDMTTALTNSVNTYFAQVGEKLGTSTLFKYMNRFGFFHDPQLDYPTDQMIPSGVYSADSSHLLSANDPIDVGRVAIGQGQLLATPMQMADVAATVANNGVLEKPTFVQQVTDTDGRTLSSLSPQTESTVMSSKTASELTSMMTKVTQEGTAAGLTVEGLPFAGKTGTAEIGDPANGINQPWFIGFAPADNPKVAVAATLERCQGCFGGEVAGPIATKVMDTILNDEGSGG